MKLELAVTARDWAEVRRLFEEYAAGLDFGLEFQSFEHELEHLPGDYSEPRGCVVVAREGPRAVGCVGVRPLEGRICEMKRLYVVADGRGSGLGRALAERALDAALCRGYEKMRLDTVPAMKVARELYRSMGFRVIEPYRYNPIPGTVYLEKALSRPAPDKVDDGSAESGRPDR